MDFQLSFAISTIRSSSDAQFEKYMRAILESLSSEQLARGIQVAQEVQAARSRQPVTPKPQTVTRAPEVKSFTITRF